MANYIHLTGDDRPIPPYTIIYKKPTNNVGGWSYAAKPEAEDSKFYELKGEWFYVVKDRDELISLRGLILNDTNITDKDGITKSIPMNNLVTTRVVDMWSIFANTPFNQPIENWDVSNVTIMRNMFRNSSFNQPIENWDTGNVVDMSIMFAYGSSFNQPIGNWDTGNVVDMGDMFSAGPQGMYGVPDFNQPIGNWDVSKVNDIHYMFYYNTVFNQDLSSWCIMGGAYQEFYDLGATSWVLPRPRIGGC